MKNYIWKKIEGKKPRVVQLYKTDLKDPLAEFGRSKKDFAKFGAFYELYLYGFVIGYHSGERFRNLEEEELDTFNLISEWKYENQLIFKNLIAVLLTNETIRDETGFNFYDLSKCDENKLDSRIRLLIKTFEEYANAGLKIIHSEFTENPNDFDHFMSLQTLHEKYVP